MNMKKPTPLSTLDIVPGKLYLAQLRVAAKDITWQPCTVNCEETTGWLRGHVVTEVDKGSLFTRVTVTFSECGTKGRVFITRKIGADGAPEPFVFSDSARQPTLIEMPVNWAEQNMQRVQAKIEALQKRMQFLKTLQAN